MSIEIYICKMPPKVGKKKLDKILEVLSDEELEKDRQFKNKADSLRFLLSRSLLRKTLARVVGLPAAEIIFKQNKYGKPSIRNAGAKNFDFNISHSENLFAIAIGRNCRVGADVEKIKNINQNFVRDYFSGKDLDYLNQFKNKAEKKEKFYELWTLKESFVKAIGKGVSYPLSQFYLLPSKGGDVKIVVSGRKSSAKKWYARSFRIGEYALAVCADENSFEYIEIKKLAI